MAGPASFEWDDAKAQSNLTKHGIPFAYAAQVFLDAEAVDYDASRLSTESRVASGWA